MADYSIIGGQVLRPSGWDEAPLHIRAGVIADEAAPGAKVIEARGAYVLPGILDMHGDAFERVIMPRPGVFFPLELALMEADRQLAGNGVTTAYHGLTISWEPGLRSLARTKAVRDAILAARGRLACDTRLHLRWETFALEEADATIALLEGEKNAILSFNDHTTTSIQKRMSPQKMTEMANRSGLTQEAYGDKLAAVWERRGEVRPAVAAMAGKGRAAGAILLAHDERSPEERREFRALGARACEFPLNRETAMEARGHGEHIVLGAPNVVRGGSHINAIPAAQAIAEGLCTVLASDYYYPSQLQAAFRLVADGICDLPAAWRLISVHPAELAGFTDRGELASGKRADVLVVERMADRSPYVLHTIAGGKPIYGFNADSASA